MSDLSLREAGAFFDDSQRAGTLKYLNYICRKCRNIAPTMVSISSTSTTKTRGFESQQGYKILHSHVVLCIYIAKRFFSKLIINSCMYLKKIKRKKILFQCKIR
jgi:hypothetical protein